MQVNWNEKYLIQLGYFSHVKPEYKVSHSDEKSILCEMSHLM